MPVEAVIFDFGGVFTTSPFENFNRYEAESGLPRDLIRRVNSLNPDTNAWALFERGAIDMDRFDALFLEETAALGHPMPGRAVMPLLSGAIRPRMVAALAACKRRFKVGCITNNMASDESPGRRPFKDPARQAAIREIMGSFDHLIESSLAGVRKPDPKIYLMMCEALGVAPGGCVYLDDLGINCKPAAALGMTAIKVVSEEQALADLSRVTGLALGAGAVA